MIWVIHYLVVLIRLVFRHSRVNVLKMKHKIVKQKIKANEKKINEDRLQKLGLLCISPGLSHNKWNDDELNSIKQSKLIEKQQAIEISKLFENDTTLVDNSPSPVTTNHINSALKRKNIPPPLNLNPSSDQLLSHNQKEKSDAVRGGETPIPLSGAPAQMRIKSPYMHQYPYQYPYQYLYPYPYPYPYTYPYDNTWQNTYQNTNVDPYQQGSRTIHGEINIQNKRFDFDFRVNCNSTNQDKDNQLNKKLFMDFCNNIWEYHQKNK